MHSSITKSVVPFPEGKSNFLSLELYAFEHLFENDPNLATFSKSTLNLAYLPTLQGNLLASELLDVHFFGK